MTDIPAIAIVGGGFSGVLTALRSSNRAGKIMVVGLELVDDMRTALLDGTLL